MTPKAESYQGWRRKRDDRWGVWEKVPGATGPKFIDVYQLLMQEELKASPHLWEYQVLPGGRSPGEGPSYRHRMMRPRP